MASPGCLVHLLSIHGLQRSLLKVNKYFNLPRSGDNPDVRKDKMINFIQLYHGSSLGCLRSEEFKNTFVFQTLAEVKTAILEKAIKNTHMKLYKFVKEVAETLHECIPDTLGMDSQSILRLLPFVNPIILDTASLQHEADKLRSAYWDADEDIVFNRVVRLGVDPSRGLATRARDLILASNASLVNVYSLWCTNYKDLRVELLSGLDQPAAQVPHLTIVSKRKPKKVILKE
jgi:hypothetical protein